MVSVLWCQGVPGPEALGLTGVCRMKGRANVAPMGCEDAKRAREGSIGLGACTSRVHRLGAFGGGLESRDLWGGT